MELGIFVCRECFWHTQFHITYHAVNVVSAWLMCKSEYHGVPQLFELRQPRLKLVQAALPVLAKHLPGWK